MTGKLNIVSTPIGNPADMTLRGLSMLEESDLVVCEEYKEAVRMLKFFEIRKELLALNEHNELVTSEEVLGMLKEGKTISLISDCGTPGFSDPGHIILNMCFDQSIPVEFCGGANSVMTALVLCGFDISRFYFAGFLSPKTETRSKELREISGIDRAVVLLETPYRLNKILEDISSVMPNRRVFAGIDLTMTTERQYRGSAREILDKLEGEKLKAEFVIIIDKE